MKRVLNSFITVFILLVTFFGSLYGAEEEREPLPCLNRTFSVVCHILVDSLGDTIATQAAILEQIEALNEPFSEICVDFEICEFRYIENFQYDQLIFDTEWPQALTEYHESFRINLFIVSDIDADPEICGKATLGGIALMHQGGIAIRCITAQTFIHEMGHFFGLSHTFEGNGSELVDGANCETEGDQICDTPADPLDPDLNDDIYYDDDTCLFTYTGQDDNGDYYVPHIGNYMSYYGGCRCQFSYGQYVKMAETYLQSNPKMW